VTVCAAFRNFGRGLLERRIALRMRRVKYRTSGAGLSAMTEQQQQQLTQATEAKAQKHRARLHTQLEAAGPYKPVWLNLAHPVHALSPATVQGALPSLTCAVWCCSSVWPSTAISQPLPSSRVGGELVGSHF
jgi:hypothetical protein